MTNHPNRGPKGPNPTPDEIAYLRQFAGLTQTKFGELVYCKLRTVQDWESGTRRVSRSTMELLCIVVALSTPLPAELEQWIRPSIRNLDWSVK